MQTALLKLLPVSITAAPRDLNQYPSGVLLAMQTRRRRALTMRYYMLSNERLRKGKIITFAGKEHQEIQGQTDTNQNYTNWADPALVRRSRVDGLFIPFQPLYNSRVFCSGFCFGLVFWGFLCFGWGIFFFFSFPCLFLRFISLNL